MNGNVSDLTITILTNIRDEIVGLRGEVVELRGEVVELRGEVVELRGEVREVRDEVRTTNERVDALTERVESGFTAVNHRLDNVIKIVGTHHGELESRVRRIEDHLGL